MNPLREGGDRGLLPGILVIVAVGVLLGLSFNLLQRVASPQNGLAWIRPDGKLERLEEVLTDSLLANGGPGAVAPETANRSPAPEQPPPPRPAQEEPASPPADARAIASKTAPPGQEELPPIPESDEPFEARYEIVRRFFDQNAAVFVDARSREEYEGGHIPGAVSLSFDEAYESPELVDSFDPGGKPIICYCSGGECELAENLAFVLIDAGYRRVLVYGGGTEAWVDSGGVLVSGPGPGGAE